MYTIPEFNFVLFALAYHFFYPDPNITPLPIMTKCGNKDEELSEGD